MGGEWGGGGLQDYIVSPSPFPQDFGFWIWDLDLEPVYGTWILDLGLTVMSVDHVRCSEILCSSSVNFQFCYNQIF